MAHANTAPEYVTSLMTGYYTIFSRIVHWPQKYGIIGGMKQEFDENRLDELIAACAAELVAKLRAQGKTCATAESCTGGGVGYAITAVPGASEVFLGGVVSYANSVKHGVLGVSQDVLDCPGPVSEECARQMAEGARRLLKADFAVSVTGLAGPGGDGIHPQGCVWFGLATPEKTIAKNVIFPGERPIVRRAAILHALSLLIP